MPGSEAGSVNGTPGKRARVEASLESGLAGGLATGHARDIQYITKFLSEESQEKMANYLAGLLRDGMMDRALAKATAASAPQVLGKKLPSKIKKLKSLPNAFEESWVRRQVLVLAEDEDAEDYTDDYLDLEEQQVNDLMGFGLNCDLETCNLPTEFVGWGYEKPMMAVLDAVAESHGFHLKHL